MTSKHVPVSRGWVPQLDREVRICAVAISCLTLVVLGPLCSRFAATSPPTLRTQAALGNQAVIDAFGVNTIDRVETLLDGSPGPDDVSAVVDLEPSTVPGLHFAAAATQTPAAPQPSGFSTNAIGVKLFSWSSPTRTMQQGLDAAFPGGQGWRDLVFKEGQGGPWTMEALKHWIEDELIAGPDPFSAHSGQVPLPWSAETDPGDQLEPGQWVTYSRRQLCFIVAKSLMGCSTNGYANGLLRFMEKTTGSGGSARTGDFGRSWWALLAACAADPGLTDGAQGPLLVVAKAGPAPDTALVRNESQGVPMSAANLRICRYDDGGPSSAPPLGIAPVPTAGCQKPGAAAPGKDFMTGGLAGQATQDISAAWLGGYVFGNAAGIGGGQDERLMVYFPEVSALVFFLSQNAGEAPQLRQPAWVLGARRLGVGLDGTCRHDLPFVVDSELPLTSDVGPVDLGSKRYLISTSRPFLGFMSENQGFLPSGSELAAATHRARRNKEPLQREVNPSVSYSFQNQVRAWYRSVALTSYDPAVRPVLQALVKSIGTGPWLAGLWFGDSQLGLLASWLGHAIAASSWGGHLPMDYYTYAAFTENPGNQCFVLSAAECRACLQRCLANPLPGTSYWLPGEAYMGQTSCVVAEANDCGQHGLEDLVQAFADKDAATLWSKIEAVLRIAGLDTTRSVFDLVLTAADGLATSK